MSLLGIYLKKVIIRRDTCTSMFLVALFTIAKTWKQPKCPSTDKYMKILYIYTMEYYLALKKNEIMALAATWDGLEIIILSEVSQTEIDRYLMISLWNLKNDTNELIVSLRNRLRKQTCGYQTRKVVVVGINQEVEINIYILVYIKYIFSKDLLYSTVQRASLVSQMVKDPSAMWDTWVQSLGWEDPIKEETTTHPSIHA